MRLQQLFPKRAAAEDESHWPSVSDLMAGLMMVFLFLSISYMRIMVEQRDEIEEARQKIQIERDQIKNIVVAWNQTENAIYEALYTEFRNDLDEWNAEIDRPTLTMRFKEPEVLFERGSDQLKPRFESILVDFFPRYLKVLEPFSRCVDERSKRPRGCIEEIRIEGHTSSEWGFGASETEAYFYNMQLSQGRTRAVLQYCYTLPQSADHPWLKQRIATIGFSSSHLILSPGGAEDPDRSREVEFRVKTTVQKQLMRVIGITP